jgi:tRNA uridine 5-carbamoylmethylation protein Kti12
VVGEVSVAGREPPRLILLCGLPGSGKTTLARRLAGQLPAVRLFAQLFEAPDSGELSLYDEPLVA